MSSDFSSFGIQPEQGPPLSAPLSFFHTAPVAIMLAGALLIIGDDAFHARGLQWTIGLAHLGTLGFLAAVMLGAMYQMLPVVAGSRVPLARLSHLVHLALVVGVAALVWSFLRLEYRTFTLAWLSLALAFVLFVVPVVIALLRAPTRTATVVGMSLAVTGLITLVTLGAYMAWVRSGGSVLGDWDGSTYAHLSIAGIVWIGGLITAVSFQVVPMFYLTAEHPRWSRSAILLGIGVTGAGVLIALAFGGPDAIVIAAAPGALALWVIHPVVTARLIHGRKRRRVDESVRFWIVGLACAPVLPALAAAAWLFDDPRWPVLLGWTALWGWAGAIIHGMLSRIVPFLVWFHRYSPLVGRVPVPPMRHLFPARHARVMLVAHVATLALGWAAIASRSTGLAQATGLGLMVTGLVTSSGLVRATLHLRGRTKQSADPASTPETG